MPEENSKKLEDLGWRQFSFFKGRDCLDLKEFIPAFSEDDLFIVLPYSCAVVNGDFQSKEPTVEVLRCKPQDKESSLFLWGRDPRTIHLELMSELFVVAKIYERFFIPHELLLEFSPDPIFQLEQKSSSALKYWIAKRYVRHAFPDAFNRRIGKVKNKLRDKLAKYSGLNNILGVYLKLDPLSEELSDDNVYDLSVVVIVTEQALASDEDSLKDFFNTFGEQFSNIDGIAFEDEVEIESESGITLGEYRELIRFDDYDFISFKSMNEDPIFSE